MGREAVVRDYGGVSAQQRREERRRKLIRAGRELWGRGGLEAISVRAVSSTAGLTHRYFYEQFANRDALIVGVAEHVREDLVQTLLTTSTETGGDVRQRFTAALTAFLRVFAGDPEVHRISTTDVSAVPGLENWQRETLDLIADLIVQYGSEVPGFPLPVSAESRRVAQFLVGGVNQLIESWRVDPDCSVDELAATASRLCMTVSGLTVHEAH